MKERNAYVRAINHSVTAKTMRSYHENQHDNNNNKNNNNNNNNNSNNNNKNYNNNILFIMNNKDALITNWNT